MAAPAETFHLMLRIEGPGQKSRVEDLVADRYTVGRGDPTGAVKTDFTVPADGALSRAHCRLHKSGPTYAVENLSPNGTTLNGKAIEKIVPLKHHDKISIGEKTTLEFLAVTGDERARELEAATAGKSAKEAASVGKTPLFQRPLVLAVLGFYVLIGLVLLFALAEEKPVVVADPGGGPYLGWMRKAPLLWDNDASQRRKMAWAMWKDVPADRAPLERRDAIAAAAFDAARLREQIPQADRRQIAADEWLAATIEHGGAVEATDAHAYYLLLAALRVLGLQGYLTLDAAVANQDDVALTAQKTLAALEARLSRLHEEADRYWVSKHRKQALEKYGEILAAVPNSHEPLRVFANHRFERLSKEKAP